ncbi:hypothetical protein SISNIDRAFT_464597 [Sistotremastrum niveocremeum HHB9708]|uniref:DUF6535 domain-containing protein n=1 Tax=Sistotremastrum niveocremeum HHB9708 TaxID=1314777 RepID=A0A164X3G8_9AGAM|nr:hypothetical protein SISNIDRAFT_464597 [Sistotremastrum niveocremeum HHB9708]
MPEGKNSKAIRTLLNNHDWNGPREYLEALEGEIERLLALSALRPDGWPIVDRPASKPILAQKNALITTSIFSPTMSAQSVPTVIPSSPNTQSKASTAAEDAFDTPRFNRLLELMEKQVVSTEEQKKALVNQGVKLDTLVKDALRDEQPYDEEEDPENNEQLWGGVYEIATAKMKEQAEEWKGLMDVSLVFIAIFLTVLTAFLVPAAQALNPAPSSPSSNSTVSAPPLPPKPAQNVCALYYLALISAMCNAVLCVLGRQWVGKLLSRPTGKTHKERTIRHEVRKELAYTWLRPLVVVLYWSLILSIGLFLSGLLYQLRNLSTSFQQPAPILETTWRLGIVLATSIVTALAATTIHATKFEGSPFEGVFSTLVVVFIEHLRNRWRWRWTQKWRAGIDRISGADQFRICMDLIAEASDPKLLDRVSSSFSYKAWVLLQWSDKVPIELLKRAYDRLMASDTSTRVRETVRAQMSRFAKYCREYPWGVEDAVIKPKFLEFLRSRYSFPSDFPTWATVISFQANNEDLREMGALSCEECLAKLTCTYDQDRQLGERYRIFEMALIHLNSFVHGGEEGRVAQFLSHVDRLSVVRSLMRAPNIWFYYFNDFLRFLVHDCRTEFLLYINEFLKNPPDNVNYTTVSYILDAILSSEFALPINTDFSPIIASVTRHPHWRAWENISSSLISYFGRCNLLALSDPTSVVMFLRQCVDPEFGDEQTPPFNTTDESRNQAQYILDTHFRHTIMPLPPSRPATPSFCINATPPAETALVKLPDIPPHSSETLETQRRQGLHRRLSSSSIHLEMSSAAN